MDEAVLCATQPNRKMRRVGLIAVVTVLIVVGLFIVIPHSTDDASLTQALVGSWTAADPANDALHRREQTVSSERAVFRPDGTLTYSVVLESKPGDPQNDLWGWKVHGGRLFVRFLGPEGTQQWLTGFTFSVSDKHLTIHVKDHPAKEFIRK